MIMEDLKKILNNKKNEIERLIDGKLKFHEQNDDIGVSLADYLLIRNRISTPQNSKIYFSRELHDTLGTSLISNNDIDVLKEIIYKMKKGSLLLPYLSRNILKNEDTLYNQWGIEHLHLSNKLENRNNGPLLFEHGVIMAKRSNLILLYHRNKKNIYLINIITHPRNYKWVLNEYFEILENNWPFLLEQYKINHTEHISPHFNNKTNYEKVKRTITLTKTKNGTYFPLGGGSSTTGSSMRYLMMANTIIRKLAAYSKKYNAKKYILKINNETNELYIKNNNANKIIDLNLYL